MSKKTPILNVSNSIDEMNKTWKPYGVQFKKPRFSLKVIRDMVKAANEHRMSPLSYASTQVTEIKKGAYKGLFVVRNWKKQRKNGKMKFFMLLYGRRNHENALFVPQTLNNNLLTDRKE